MRTAVVFLSLSALLSIAPLVEAQRRQTPTASSAPAIDSAVYGQLHFRHIGPEGNRVTSVAGVPGDPGTYYAGAAAGVCRRCASTRGALIRRADNDRKTTALRMTAPSVVVREARPVHQRRPASFPCSSNCSRMVSIFCR